MRKAVLLVFLEVYVMHISTNQIVIVIQSLEQILASRMYFLKQGFYVAMNVVAVVSYTLFNIYEKSDIKKAPDISA